MLQRAHVLPSEPVVRHPLLLVVVLRPGDVPDVPHVDVHPREGDFSHHAPAADGVGHGVEQAVGEARVFYDLGLVLATRDKSTCRSISCSGSANTSILRFGPIRRTGKANLELWMV